MIKLIILILFFSISSVFAEVNLQIQRTRNPQKPIRMRVVEGKPNAVYMIYKSCDYGQTWEPFILAKYRNWVSIKPQLPYAWFTAEYYSHSGKSKNH